jgi:hypothetical protein
LNVNNQTCQCRTLNTPITRGIGTTYIFLSITTTTKSTITEKTYIFSASYTTRRIPATHTAPKRKHKQQLTQVNDFKQNESKLK